MVILMLKDDLYELSEIEDVDKIQEKFDLIFTTIKLMGYKTSSSETTLKIGKRKMNYYMKLENKGLFLTIGLYRNRTVDYIDVEFDYDQIFACDTYRWDDHEDENILLKLLDKTLDYL